MSAKDIVLGAASGGAAVATPTYVDDVFSTYLYTGNGNYQTINNGIDLAGKGGLVWSKKRNGVENNSLVDTIRGAGNQLQSNTTYAQGYNNYLCTAFYSNGYQALGDGYTYASWTFRKAAKFFDVVTYTGNGSSILLSHSLGVSPGMVIIKRTDAAGDWGVWHIGGSSGDCSLLLNSSAAKYGAGVAFSPSATSIRVYNSDFAMLGNINGATYVAYLFAHDTAADGMIQCGSFTVAGSGNATVNLGWEPQWVLRKISTAVDNWKVEDTMRGMSQTSYGILFPNLSEAESAGSSTSYHIIPNATGFTVSGQSAGTYIYMAIRRPNKPPTSGTQVFSAHTWFQSAGL